MNCADTVDTPSVFRVPNGLGRVLERLSETDNVSFGVTIAAPVISPSQLFLAWPGESAVLWSSSADCCEVGLGTSARCQGSGPNRIATIIEKAEQVAFGFQGVGVGAAAAEPRFFGVTRRRC